MMQLVKMFFIIYYFFQIDLVYSQPTFPTTLRAMTSLIKYRLPEASQSKSLIVRAPPKQSLIAVSSPMTVSEERNNSLLLHLDLNFY